MLFPRIPFLIFMFSSSLLVLTMGCNSDNDSDLVDDANPENTTYFPSEIWVNDALDRIQADQDYYTVYCQLPSNGAEVAIKFNQARELKQIDTDLGSAQDHSFYYDQSRLVFSAHQSSTNGSKYLMAYANSRPYASAKWIDQKWESASITPLPFKEASLPILDGLQASRQNLEKGTTAYHRILNPSESISGEIGKGSKKHYVLNLRKGDRVESTIESQTDDVFFSVSTDTGSIIEYRDWNHEARESGDIIFTVSSPSDAALLNFTLNITRVRNTQNPNSAEAIRVVAASLFEP